MLRWYLLIEMTITRFWLTWQTPGGHQVSHRQMESHIHLDNLTASASHKSWEQVDNESHGIHAVPSYSGNIPPPKTNERWKMKFPFEDFPFSGHIPSFSGGFFLSKPYMKPIVSREFFSGWQWIFRNWPQKTFKDPYRRRAQKGAKSM